MKNKKVNAILGEQELTEAKPIEVTIFCSGVPVWPWAASSGGQACLGRTMHIAFDALMEKLAQRKRAEEQE